MKGPFQLVKVSLVWGDHNHHKTLLPFAPDEWKNSIGGKINKGSRSSI